MNMKKELDEMKDFGVRMNHPVSFKIKNAKELLLYGINFFTDYKGQWLPEYDEISDWLSDNQGKGLLCIGNCGRGKSLFCTKVIPLLIHSRCRLVVNTYTSIEMNNNPDDVMAKRLIALDDIGIEGEQSRYGEKRLIFPEIVDNAERTGSMMLITSNLPTTGTDSIESKYGIRTIDRLRGMTKIVVFKGKSLRG